MYKSYHFNIIKSRFFYDITIVKIKKILYNIKKVKGRENMGTKNEYDYINDPKTFSIISSCPLFKDLKLNELTEALSFFDANFRKYKKGDFIQSVLSPFTRFGLVISGSIQVYCDDINGYPMIMANVSEGDTFGESLCYTRAESPVYICATSDSEVILMSTQKLPELNDEISRKMILRFTEMLANRTLAMNERIQILSKITLKEKILTMLNQYRHKLGSDRFSLPFDRANMAIYLGTDRTALSRELSRLKKDGLIDFKKNNFIIKK